jgi:hypothetical protein
MFFILLSGLIFMGLTQEIVDKVKVTVYLSVLRKIKYN